MPKVLITALIFCSIGFSQGLSGIGNLIGPSVSVKAFGAVGDGVRNTDGVMNTSSPNTLTSAAGSFTSTDVGKYIQIIGAGPGGTTGTSGVMTLGSFTLTDSGASFATTDVGRHIQVAGAGAAGAYLVTTIVKYNSGTSVTLLNAAATAVSGASYWYGYSTLEANIMTVVSSTQITISAVTVANVRSATYVYGTDDTYNIQQAINFIGAIGGGTLMFPNTAPGNIYVVRTPSVAVTIPADLAITNNNVSLIGDSSKPTIACKGAWTTFSGAVVRGHCLAVGTGSGGQSNITVQNLVLDGMTDGNTWNASFPASTTTGDGWDVTDKAIWLAPNVTQGPFTVNNVTMQNFKGEELYFGGTDSQLANLTSTNNTFSNTNADGISVSAQNLTATGNTFSNIFNAGFENGVDSTMGTHKISGNRFSTVQRQGLVYVLTQNSITAPGSVDVSGNVFDTIGWAPGFGYSNGAQAAVDFDLQSGITGSFFTNVLIHDNLYHDTVYGIESNVIKGGKIQNNVFQIDQFNLSFGPGYALDFGLKQMSDVMVSDNHGYLSPVAIANSVHWYNGPINSIGDSAGASTVGYSNVIVQDNVFNNSGGPYFRVATSSGFFTALSNKAIIWRRNVCTGCVTSGTNNGNLGTISSGGTITPILDQVLVQSSASIPATIDASKSQDGQEVRIINSGSNNITFSADANINLANSLVLAAGLDSLFRFSFVSGKWELVQPNSSGGSGSLPIQANGTGVGTASTALNFIPGTYITQSVPACSSGVCSYQPDVDVTKIPTNSTIQLGQLLGLVTTSSSSSTYTATMALNDPITAYSDRAVYYWNVGSTACAGGAMTLNIDSLGQINLKQADGVTNMIASQCTANLVVPLVYNATSNTFNGPSAPGGGGPVTAYNSSSQAIATSTLTTVTGTSLSLAASTNYQFTMWAYATMSANTVVTQLNCTCTVNTVSYTIEPYDPSNGIFNQTRYYSALAQLNYPGTTPGALGQRFEVKGWISVNAAGILSFQAANNTTGTVTIDAGAHARAFVD